MKIEDQLCSLESAKKLKELGMTQESYFAYCTVCPDPLGENWFSGIISHDHEWASQCEMVAAMFTVAELGRALLDKCFPEKQSTIWYSITDNGEVAHNTEAEARAMMLIYLLEKDFINIDQVNESVLNN